MLNLFQTSSISASVLTLTAISVERWYAICHPLRFHSTVRRARIIVATIWIISACVALPETISSEAKPEWEHEVLFTTCYPVKLGHAGATIWQFCLFVGVYCVPICLMGFTYTHIAYVLYTGSIPGAGETSKHRFLKYPKISFLHSLRHTCLKKYLISIYFNRRFNIFVNSNRYKMKQKRS